MIPDSKVTIVLDKNNVCGLSIVSQIRASSVLKNP